eukprot:Selendium_serpulae@DN4845_c2_g1_i2.p1
MLSEHLEIQHEEELRAMLASLDDLMDGCSALGDERSLTWAGFVVQVDDVHRSLQALRRRMSEVFNVAVAFPRETKPEFDQVNTVPDLLHTSLCDAATAASSEHLAQFESSVAPLPRSDLEVGSLKSSLEMKLEQHRQMLDELKVHMDAYPLRNILMALYKGTQLEPPTRPD